MIAIEERAKHSYALRMLRTNEGIDGMRAVLQAYAHWHRDMYDRIAMTVAHVEANISPLALARFVVEYQIIVQIRRCDERLGAQKYIIQDDEDISLVA